MLQQIDDVLTPDMREYVMMQAVKRHALLVGFEREHLRRRYQ